MEKEQLQELIENNKEDIFSEIKDEISDDTVTDIEWDGYNLWITQLGRGCYISMKELSDKYMDNLSIRLANIMGASFNRMHPILEANTESLRIFLIAMLFLPHLDSCHIEILKDSVLASNIGCILLKDAPIILASLIDRLRMRYLMIL